MKRFLFIPLLLSLFITACRPTNLGEQAVATTEANVLVPEPTQVELTAAPSSQEDGQDGVTAGSPEEVTLTFYNWYLEQTSGPNGELRNPIRDGSFAEGPGLSPQFIREVVQISSSFEGGGYDPVLLASPGYSRAS